MACRPGPLRVERSLRDLYIPFGSRLPLVACEMFAPTSGRLTPKAVYASRSDRRPRRAPARQRSPLQKDTSILSRR